MHEVSLMAELLDQVAGIALNNRGVVEEIHVKVGPLSGVEPLLLEAAFAQLVVDSPVAGSRLIVEEVALIAHCTGCSREFVPEHFAFRCPSCNSDNTRIVQGDAVMLQSVVLNRDGESSAEGQTDG